MLVFPLLCRTFSEKAMAPHSSTLAWKIPWTEEPGGLQSMGSQLSNFTFTFHFHALEKETATHSGVLAWRIPGTAEPGGLNILGSPGGSVVKIICLPMQETSILNVFDCSEVEESWVYHILQGIFLTLVSCISGIGRRILYHRATWDAQSLQLYPTL